MTTIVKDSYTLMLGDCLERMREITDGSIDMVLADLPYGTTACKWDTVIDFEPLWRAYWRILKDNGAIVLFGTQPFTTEIIRSQAKHFRYEWIWQKTIGTNFHFVKRQPFKKHENVLIFYRKQPTYHPQMEAGTPYKDSARKRTEGYYGGRETIKAPINNAGTRYPSTVQLFSNANNGNVHPTQKPVPLLEYFIRTYTGAGEVVLDNTMGSGSTGMAALLAGRRFIGIEKEAAYFEIAAERLSLAQSAGTTSDSTQSPADLDDSAPSVHDVSAVPGNC